jgi:hypothetical protein
LTGHIALLFFVFLIVLFEGARTVQGIHWWLGKLAGDACLLSDADADRTVTFGRIIARLSGQFIWLFHQARRRRIEEDSYWI